MIYINTRTSIASAYPTFAQQGYKNPREATGCIVCVRVYCMCQLPFRLFVEIEVPQAVEVNWVPRLEIMDTGTPCNFTISLKYNLT